MLIFGNDARLLRDRALDHKVESGAIPAQHLLQFPFEKLEKLRVADHAVLDDFVDSRSKFARRQTAQQSRIGHNALRRVKRSDEILSFRKIHARLSADRAIDLRHDGCRNMDQRDSARIARRDESSHVADHSSAHGNDERAPVRARANQIAAGSFDSGKIFRGFRVIDQNRGAPRVCKQPFDARAPMPPHARRRNHKHRAILLDAGHQRAAIPAARPGRTAHRISRSPPELKFSSSVVFAGDFL